MSSFGGSSVIVNAQLYTELLPNEVSQGSPIPKVYPVSDAAALLLMKTFASNDPVESLRSRQGRAEPDLLVRWLLVEDIRALILEVNFKYTSL